MPTPYAKLLVIAPFKIWPPHFGSSERAYNVTKRLAGESRFGVSLIYTDYAHVKGLVQNSEVWPGATIKPIGPAKRYTQFFYPRLIVEALRLIRRERPDLILCEHLWAGIHAALLHTLTGVPFILDDHNAEYVRFKRMQRKSAWLIRIWEQVVCRLAADVIAVSQDDRQHLLDLGVPAAKIAVVPNAVDVDQYRPNPVAGAAIREKLGLSPAQPLFLFYGKLDYQPNAEAVHIIVNEIMPRVLQKMPEARFMICGYHPPEKKYTHSQLTFTGIVPRIEDYINAATGVIVPLISGGGTKFKIIQTLACGKPVITTSVGAEGIENAGSWMQVADDWDMFSRLVLQLPGSSQTYSPESLDQFRQRYSWQAMNALMVQLLDRRLTLLRKA